jgi:hypothetical protein
LVVDGRADCSGYETWFQLTEGLAVAVAVAIVVEVAALDATLAG